MMLQSDGINLGGSMGVTEGLSPDTRKQERNVTVVCNQEGYDTVPLLW